MGDSLEIMNQKHKTALHQSRLSFLLILNFLILHYLNAKFLFCRYNDRRNNF